tara:strand:- start:324 stop:425 length:102 start_codon:yes stop_codon:yes gene_type:complete
VSTIGDNPSDEDDDEMDNLSNEPQYDNILKKEK